MRNETINWTKQTNDRIKQTVVENTGKKVDDFKTRWFHYLTEAAKIGTKAYKKAKKDMINAYHEKNKGPALKLDEIKVKPLKIVN